MTSAAIIKRLEALEARRQDTYVAPKPPSLALYIVAYFGGKFDPVQSPFGNYAAALGCASAAAFHKLSADEIAERHAKAWQRICRRRGIDPQTLEPWPKAEKMLRQLSKAGLPIPAENWGGCAGVGHAPIGPAKVG
jgi:hypothetical protein